MDAQGTTQVCPSPVTTAEPGLAVQEGGALPCYLIVVRGGIPGTMLRLVQSASSLGRSADNTFAIHDDTVSRRHAVIAIDASDDAWLTDLGSTNGTFVDGSRVRGHAPVKVNDGSRIQLGASTLLKFLKLDACEAGFQREMYERAVRDNLTGLYNRGYFLNQIGPLRDLSAMRELGLAVILVDIDHFKQVNDAHGHDAGDLVLAQVAAALREATRTEDLVSRYGGEEFVLALPCGSQDQAMERAEHIRLILADRTMRAFGVEIRVTASLGVSFTPAERIQDVAIMISAADEALYDAKRTGRNRVSLSRRGLQVCSRMTTSADALVVFSS